MIETGNRDVVGPEQKEEKVTFSTFLVLGGQRSCRRQKEESLLTRRKQKKKKRYINKTNSKTTCCDKFIFLLCPWKKQSRSQTATYHAALHI